MAFWIPMAIGAGVGLLKNREDQRAIKKQNRAAAAQTEFSALTGMGPGRIQRAPSAWEGMMQGAMAGAQFGAAGKAAGLFGGGAGMNGGQAIDPMAQQAVTGMQNDMGAYGGQNTGAYGGGYAGSFDPNKSRWQQMMQG